MNSYSLYKTTILVKKKKKNCLPWLNLMLKNHLFMHAKHMAIQPKAAEKLKDKPNYTNKHYRMADANI